MSQPQVTVNGIVWSLFACDFDTQEGKFTFNLYAIDMPHAIERLAELKATARIDGQVVEVIPFN